MKIDLFAPPRSRYKALHYMTECLLEALIAQGADCRLYDSETTKAPMDFLNNFLEDPPELTISFNGLLPDDKGVFFCDMVEVPHLALLVDSPPHFFPLVKSPLTLIASIDEFFTEFFKGFEKSNAFFSPHASGGKNPTSPAVSREYDIVMLGSYMDPDAIRKNWSHPADICKVMEETAEMTLSNPDKSFIECFTACLGKLVGIAKIDISQLDYAGILVDIEDYVRALDRKQLVEALKGFQVYVFGEGDWSQLSQEGLTVHGPVDFSESLEIFEKAKIAINSTAHIKNGSHERFFESLVKGALPLSSNNLYLENRYSDSALFYRTSAPETVREQVEALLKDESKRVNMAEKGQKRVLSEDLWSNRAEALLKQLPPLLAKL